MDILIRKASINDIDNIIKLNKILFDLEYNNFDNTLDINWPLSSDGYNYFEESICNGITLVAVVDNVVVGYLIGSLNTELSYNIIKQAELENMCILDDYRKYGIGTKLFNEFKNICKDNKIEEIKVTASYDNKSAINFYKKNGFKEREITLKQKVEYE